MKLDLALSVMNSLIGFRFHALALVKREGGSDSVEVDRLRAEYLRLCAERDTLAMQEMQDEAALDRVIAEYGAEVQRLGDQARQG